VHDPLGRRIAKKVGGVITEKYLWQGLTRLLAVYDGNDSLLMRFGYADARMPVAVTKGDATYYLAYDQAGTLKAVADASGNVVKRIEYDTFGNILGDSNPAFAVPFGFAGGLYDRDTGLVRFGYRDYDPETGRWTAKDPILFAGGDSDLYGYCLNDPVNLSDSGGKIPVPVIAGVIAGTIVGAVDFITTFIATQSIGEAAASAVLSGVTATVGVGLGTAGVTFLAAGFAATGVHSLLQMILNHDLNFMCAVYNGFASSAGGYFLLFYEMTPIAGGVVNGIILAPINWAGNVLFSDEDLFPEDPCPEGCF
jgi:RHS repeat-associated protein